MTLTKVSRSDGSVPAVLDTDSFVSDRLGFVYLCVPKTLSRSMLEYLAGVDPAGYRLAARGAGKEVLCLTTGSGGRTRFSFARNPYSRAVAVYYDKFVNFEDTPGQRRLFGQYDGLDPTMSFVEFVEWLATDEASDPYADPHFLPQHYFLYDADGRPALDYLGRVEDASSDLAELQALLGLPPQPLPRVKTNAAASRAPFDTAARWREVLDDHTIRILSNRYDGDLDLLGYERLTYSVRPLFSRGDARVVPSGKPRRRAGLVGRMRGAVKRCFASWGFEVRRTRRAERRRRAAT